MKLISLTGYLGLIWTVLVSLCIAPGESVAQTTHYARVVAQAERIAYLAAQRSAMASQVASAAVAPSAASLAVRMVAGPVGWAALGVGAGLVLAQMYYSPSDLSAIKSAASTPGGWQVSSSNAGTQTFPGLGTNTPGNPSYPNASIQFSTTNVPLCAVDSEYQHDWMVGPFHSVSTAVYFSGNFFVNGPPVGGHSLYVCHRKGIPGEPAPLQDASTPPTQQQAANYVSGTTSE